MSNQSDTKAEAERSLSEIETDHFIEQVWTLLNDANAAEERHHQFQIIGHYYGNLHKTLHDLLVLRYGEETGEAVLAGMVESGEGAPYVAAYLQKRAEAETFTCKCGEFEFILADTDDDTVWCPGCGLRIDEQRQLHQRARR